MGVNTLSEEIHKSNRKRTYDAYQDLDLNAARNNADLVNERARRSQENFDKLNNIAIQALQNAVETSNLTGKQSIRHSGLEEDQLWNLEPSEAKSMSEIISSPALDALATTLAGKIADVLNDNE